MKGTLVAAKRDAQQFSKSVMSSADDLSRRIISKEISLTAAVPVRSASLGATYLGIADQGRRFSSGMTALFLLSVAALVLTGCTPAHPAGFESEGHAYNTAILTCSGYSSLSTHDRTAALDENGGVTEFTNTGVKNWTSAVAFYSNKCKSAGNSKKTLDQLRPKTPSCDEWANVPDVLKTAWIRGALSNAASTPDAELLSVTSEQCNTIPADQRSDFTNALFAISAAANRASTDQKVATVLTKSITWSTTTKLGFTTQMLVRIASAPLPKGTTTHPLDDKTKVGVACGFDTTKDIAIPAQLLVTNSSSNPAEIKASYELDHVVPSGSVSPEVTTGYVESGVCDAESNGTAGLESASEKSVNPSDRISSLFFVVIKNYYSPRYPNGAVDELSHYQLASRAYVGDTSADPVVQMSPEHVSLTLP